MAFDINNLIKGISRDNLKRFCRDKSGNFRESAHGTITHSNTDLFSIETYKNYFQTLDIVGYFTDIKVLVFMVALTPDLNLRERSCRRLQFDFAKDIMKKASYGGNQHNNLTAWLKDEAPHIVKQALFVFADENGAFRFSLVENIDKNAEIAQRFKRYTFFVNDEQSNRTFKEQMQGGKWDKYETLQKAFSVEKLSDDFFNAYKEYYQKFIDSAVIIGDDSKKIFTDTGDKDKALRDYVKKMMGRLVFLQFLAKKGWLGVPEGAEWGNGDKEYLKNLFENSSDKDNFLDAVLEKLFFNTLNQDRGAAAIADTVLAVNGGKVRIPYLNGGLFEEDKLDKAKVKFPSEFFAGLFDTFERYNFTIDENDPDDKEVGVDPEMLGRIFENLLEDNKDKGAFYTPKEIVQYMCEESLIAYLGDTEPNRKLVKEFDASEITNAHDLLAELQDVKICDPAIGSGAFPMGMLNILYRIRLILEGKDFTSENIVAVKKEIIQNNIYGVDIEAGAVDIARLRFWLSIVVDEDKPIPLPNFDYKIMQGNSLLEQYNGVDLKLDLRATDKKGKKVNTQVIEQQMYFAWDDETQALENLKAAMNDFFEPDAGANKNQLRNAIDAAVKNYIKTKCGNAPDINAAVDEMDLNDKPFFLWHLYFADVFVKKGGFDIVIGNPPYVSTKGRTEEENNLLKAEYDFADDLYSHFIIQGFRLLREKGIQCQITSDTYFTTLTKQNVREELLKNTFVQLVHWGHDIFESAMVSTATFISRKQKSTKEHVFDIWDVKGRKSIAYGSHYKLTQKEYSSSINGAFFIPNEQNLQLNKLFAPKHKKLLADWWTKIDTSRNIAKNETELHKYRDKLAAGDLTLIGLVTDGGQGLATANNGKYVGVLHHTKAAENIRVSRVKKLKEFNAKYHTDFSLPDSEEAIWQLFDSLKEQYGRDCFGQGYIFRIVPNNLIADVANLTEDEKTNGINSSASFVPYDKGDKDGNRWYLETPYLINWSRENVAFLKDNSGKKGKGMPVVRNPKFYFKEGFCYSDIKTFFIRCRLKGQSVHDVKSMSLFPVAAQLPFYYIVTMINSHLTASLVYNFLNNTPSFQMNDCRMLPIIVPTEAQLVKCKELFDAAIDIQKQFFAGELTKDNRDKELRDIQDKIDEFVYNLYGISCKDYLNHSNSVFEKSDVEVSEKKNSSSCSHTANNSNIEDEDEWRD